MALPKVTKSLGIVAFYVLLIRLFLGYVFFSSSLCKLSKGQFPQLIGPCNLETKLAPYGLALFVVVIAIAQLVIGALVLSQRYALLGSVMMVPMNVSILGVTVSQGWQGTPYIDAFLLLLNIVLLLYHFPSLKFFLFPLDQNLRVPTKLDLAFEQTLPHVALGVALIAGITSRFSQATMLITGTVALILFYAIVLRSSALSRLEKIIVALSLIAILALTLTWPVLQPAVVLGVLLVVIASIVLALEIYTVQYAIGKRNVELSKF
jgi:uncharacterized membrane protein YphA (DoxX/SURF4 family)